LTHFSNNIAGKTYGYIVVGWFLITYIKIS
jgi:hypothetical protein